MKIGLSCFVMQLGRTGISTYIVSLLRSLQQLDHNNAYDILVPEPDAPLLPPPAPNFHHRITSRLFARPIPGICWHNTVLPRLASKEKYDLIHIPSYRRVPAVKNTPLLATVHDLAPLSMPDKYDMARTFYNRQVVPQLLKNCDHIVAVSEFTKNDIIRYVGFPEEKISVVYSGIDKEIYRPLDKAECVHYLSQQYGLNAPYFVYVSRLEHPGKNHINLIRAFESFKKKNNSPHHLVLVGAEWPGAEVILEAARTSPVADQIHYLGFVPTQDTVALYTASDLMIHPSYVEGFGFPVAEAAACGAKVICSNTSSLKELADLAGLDTFNPDEPESIRECIERSLERGYSSQERERMLQFAQRFDWDQTAKTMQQIYESVP